MGEHQDTLPVDVGVKQHSCVCGQLGQMDHLGFLLQSVALVHPDVWQSTREYSDVNTMKQMFTVRTHGQSPHYRMSLFSEEAALWLWHRNIVFTMGTA